MNRFWMGSLIRVLQTVAEQLTEFSAKVKEPTVTTACERISRHLRQVIWDLQDVYMFLQKTEK